MENVTNIIGADISKRTIDLHHHGSNQPLLIDNSTAGYRQMLSWIRKQKINLTDVLIVMEHTGLYSYCFETFLFARQIRFTKVSALEIKLSSGVTRGKSDKIDAARIAAYGYEKRFKLQETQSVSQSLKRLQILHSTRDRYVKMRASFLCVVKEYRNMGMAANDLIMRSHLQMIDNFNKQIDKLEESIKSVIQTEEDINHNYKLLTSISGVGPVLATATIVKTSNFTRFKNGRKFACYCGTAPFEHSSGSSIKGKTKVSHLADKQMKTLLDLAAKSAIRNDQELKTYYRQRTEKGKPKMSTINIIRNKLINRMFAVIKRQSPFLNNYLKAA